MTMKIECLLPVYEDGKVKMANGQFVFDWHLCEVIGQTAAGLSIKKSDGTISHNFLRSNDNCRDVADEPQPSVQESPEPEPINDVQPPHGTAPLKPEKAENIKQTRKYNKKGKR